MFTIEKDHERGDSLVLITKGAPDVLLGRCTRVRISNDVVELTDEIRQRLPTALLERNRRAIGGSEAEPDLRRDGGDHRPSARKLRWPSQRRTLPGSG
jgi:hypothetical protein